MGESKAFCQFYAPTPSARGAAMGGCSVALDDYWSAINGIAGTAFLEHYTIGVSLTQSYSGQAYKNLSAALPTGHAGTAIMNYCHYGNTAYNEQHLFLGYALRLAQRLSAGLTLDYLHSGTNDAYYLPINLLTFAAALQYRPFDRLILSAKVFNPLNVDMNTETATSLPVMANIGFSYRLLDPLLATAEIEALSSSRPTARLGLEYTLYDHFLARMGFSSQPTSWSFGLGYRGACYCVDLAAQVHPILGLIPQISANYSF